MATGKPRGRPRKQTVSQKITSALDIAQDEITSLMPIEQQNALVPVIKTPEVIVAASPQMVKDAKDDYDFARNNLHNLLSKGNKLLEGMSELCSESESPRAYEVAGNLIKTLVEGTRELMTLQKDIREVEKKNSPDVAPVTIENADEVNQYNIEGTTMEMLEAINEIRRKKIENQQTKETK
jgi:hypothetical protein